MADPRPVPALAGALRVGRHGVADGEPGVRVADVTPASMVQIHGLRDAPAAALAVLDVETLPAPQHAARGERGRVLWTGPGQYLAASDAHAASALAAALEEALADAGAVVVDLSHARATIRVRGPAARDVLAAGCPLDVEALVPGDAMPTVAGHFNVLLHCTGADVFEVYVTRSFAVAFSEWLLAAGAEFGVDVEG